MTGKTISKRCNNGTKAQAPNTRDTNTPSRFDTLEQMLTGAEGTTIAAMMVATGWQQHSVRGALAGALKKRGLTITSHKIDGTRYYHGTRAA